MKRTIFFGGILVFILMASLSYAQMQKVSITKENLADLQGKWEGFRSVHASTANADLDIFNATPPLKGKLTFYNVVGMVARTPRTETFDFGGGKINEKGNFYLKSTNVEVELSLYKSDGKMKLEGDFYWRGAKGTMSFKKK